MGLFSEWFLSIVTRLLRNSVEIGSNKKCQATTIEVEEEAIGDENLVEAAAKADGAETTGADKVEARGRKDKFLKQKSAYRRFFVLSATSQSAHMYKRTIPKELGVALKIYV